MNPQVRVLRAALWRSLSSEGVPLRCGLQTWGLLCEVCVVLCSGRGRDTVSLVTRGNSVFVQLILFEIQERCGVLKNFML